MNKYIAIFSLLGLSSNVAQASGITVDGVLDEKIWQDAQLIDNFVTTAPYSLAAPEFKTQVRMLTNEQGIYIGITNYQPQNSQLRNRSARDTSIEADYNNIVIDFDNSGVEAYQFSIGNGGSISDGTFSNENRYSREWDGVWYAKTSADQQHWYTEVLIPWDVAPMALTDNGKRALGFHVERYVASKQKTFASQALHQSKQRFLSDIQPVAVKDYAKASLQTFVSLTARQDRVADKNRVDASVDVFWKPDSSKQLSLTINPDFGHVDSDNLVVNFSPTETFFSENRAFFTENQSLFTLNGPDNLRLVHTRRIGAKPDIGDTVGADINAALKFTSVNDELSYGFFSAMEDSDSVAQGRDFYAGRIMRKTDDYNLGYLATFTDRPDLDRDAWVHAIDYGYFVNDDIRLSGQVMSSSISQQGNKTNDSAAWFTLGQQFSKNWEHSLTAAYLGDEFQVNDLGFLPRNNLRSFSYLNTYIQHDFSANSMFQEHKMVGKLEHKENTQGLTLHSSLRFIDIWKLKDSSWLQWHIKLEDSAYDDLITRGANRLKLKQGKELDFIYFGESKGKLRYHLHSTLFDRSIDGKGYLVHAHPSYYFTDNYVLTLGLWYTQSSDWLIWQQGNTLNSYRRKEFQTNINFNATLDDKQELNIKFQWIALAAQGRQAYQVDTQGALNSQHLDVNDFSVSDTAIQVRYRYQIAPLSNIYLVYSRGGRTSLDDNESFSSLFSPGWQQRDGDNLSLKVRYQF